jgi:GNAT superfamily N-acetyltransferase
MRRSQTAWEHGGMGWQTTGDVTEFLTTAGAFLRGDRARNTVMLSVTESMRANPARYRTGNGADPATLPVFGWWTDGVAGQVQGAFLVTPPFPVLLSAVPPAAAADLAAKTLAGRPLPGVNSYDEAATAFAAAWRDATGCRVGVHRRMRLYRLAELTWPRPLPHGAPRPAAAGDVVLAADWFTSFAREVHDMDDTDQAAAVRDRLSYGGLILWELDGTPVSLAGFTRRVAGMVRVAPVYTPPELRGHGYASAVTADVSRAALADGAEEVVLYTDLANPVSNSIYQRIGYRPVEDRVVLSFSGQ